MSKIKVVYDRSSKMTWVIRVVERGELFGASGSICHGKDEPLVEFYDSRYAFEDLGQFVSRYNLTTLLNRVPSGLCLQGGVPEWVVYPEAMADVVAWLAKEYPQPVGGREPPTGIHQASPTIESVVTGTAGAGVPEQDLQGMVLQFWYLAPPSVQQAFLRSPAVARAERSNGLPAGELLSQLNWKLEQMRRHITDAGYLVGESEVGFYWETSYERSGDFAHQADATADAYRDLMSSIANGG